VTTTDSKLKFPQPSKKDLQTIARFVCSSLKEDYFSVINDLFEDEKALNILHEVKRLHNSGVFQDGQLSGGKTGNPKTRNGGMTERSKITPNLKTRNGGKSPQILKHGMAENHPKS